VIRRAILYCRVSTDEQADRGYSLNDQEDRLRQYCIKNNIEVDCIFREDHSAKNFNRPQFKKLLGHIRLNKGKFYILLFVKWDRFSRNAPEAYEMLTKLTKLGVVPSAIEQPIDLSIPENKIMLAIYLSTPEVENDRRSLNVTHGMRRAKLEGRWPCMAPIGFSNKRDENNRPIILPNKNAKFIVKVFKEIRRDQHTLEEIRKSLLKEGFNCSKSNFHKMIRNPIYTGKIYVEALNDQPAAIVDGVHQPIIPTELYYEVQEVLTKRRENNKQPVGHSVHEQLPLRGKLKCPKCGRQLTGSGSKGNGGRFFYYHCSKGCKVRIRADMLNRKVLNIIKNISVDSEIKDAYKNIVRDILDSETHNKESRLINLNKTIESLQTRILNLEDKLADNEISTEDYFRIKMRYENDIMELKKQKAEINIISKDFLIKLKYCSNTIVDIGKFYSNTDVSIKREIIGSIFPGYLVFSGKKVRTDRVNEVVKLFCPSFERYEIKKRGRKPENSLSSSQVIPRGLEPPP
jgi:site-specific DNA recombinase